LLASVNHGRPSIAATARPGEFRGNGVVGSRGGDRPMDNRAVNRNVPRPQNDVRNMNRGNDRPNMSRPMPREDNRGGSAPRPESRGGNAPRPSAYHPDNARGHESAPRPEKEDHGHK
jgi:hypothetical protein